MLNNAITNEGQLFSSLKRLFPEERILTNVTKQHEVKYEDTGKFLEFDVWLPKQDICFEFQDEYHYKPTWNSGRTVQEIKLKDGMKKQNVLQKRISLVDIPCWWDGALSSLGSTIHFQRPDLLPTDDNPHEIPLNPKIDFFQNTEIPNVGQLMLVKFIEDNKQFRPSSEWWVGEKYDGVRCYWNHLDKSAYSRYGRNIILPDTFAKQLPSADIDTELWFGRNQFGLAVSLLNKSDSDPVLLEFFRLLVFDIASYSVKEKQFEQRYAYLLSAISSEHPNLILAFRMMCVNNGHLNTLVQDIAKDEGEGLILQQSSSQYENGKSNSILKMKVVGGDEEALVVDAKADGSLRLKLPNNTHFWVPHEDVHISGPIVGDIVSFSYKSTAKGEPMRPIVFRIRKDLSWDSASPTSVPSWKDAWKRRAFFDNFAASKKIDPLNPSSWYSISASEVVQYNPEYYKIVKYHGTKLSDCLMQLYPDIGLQQSQFAKKKKYWKSFCNRKEVLLQFAKMRSFDPFVPTNWYSLSYNDLASFKLAKRMLQYYDNNYSAAILDLFPDLNISLGSFKKTPMGQWEKVENRRERFCSLARSLGFDPLIPHNWYSISYPLLENIKGPSSMLKNYYNCNVAQGLMDMFPDIGLVKTEFQGKGIWHKSFRNQKWYLESVASKYKFNSRNISDWNSFLNKLSPKKHSHLSKNIKKILGKYNSLEDTLATIFN